ncbi:MAG: methylated-DNA--[protein]-cysteine S-methyltransferase [Acidobacteria bacterium]|nr:methylated-DNA--[protein]-cysteine S-methyltransferase [Acidobacteriota bacterium]MBI3279922.1 methylated-DNA--[protein]-cysteine S-methyltransferase [Acidobacteriota bacterium]
MTTCYTHLESPLGRLLLAGDELGLRLIGFTAGRHASEPVEAWREDAAQFAEAARQLAAYFGGELREFQLPLAPEGTAFQLRVWRELQRIPYGETISYGELARRMGNSKASRAVGLANGANPLPIVIPCHRVIGGDGTLTGYGGGLEIKRKLLELERARVCNAAQPGRLF